MAVCTFLALAFFATLPGFSLGIVARHFSDPQPSYRPKFRYWLPDASVSSDVVARDMHDVKDAGAGGLELLPFYLYGMGVQSAERAKESPIPTLPDWSEYGFGTPAFVTLFKNSLKAAQESGILLDYALGANQGQGVPSAPSTPGLSVELLMGNTTIGPHSSFSAPVPQARQPSATLLSGLGFQHPLEQFGTPNLTAVMAYQVLSQTAPDNITGMKKIHLKESSFLDLMPLVKEDLTLQWSPPSLDQTWKIFTFWESYTNQRSCDGGLNATTWLGNGSWTVDHFSTWGASRITDFWDKYILSDSEIADLLKSVGNYAWEDSMEILATLYWTPGLLNKFQNTHGYDLTPYLPLLITSSNTWNGVVPVYDEVFAFDNENNIENSVHQLDYRQVLNDGYQEYLSHFQKWSHSMGTKYSAQPAYNLPLQMLSDIDLLDAPEGESLGFAQNIDAYRQFSGPAHLTNKSVVSTELGAVNVPPYSLTVPNLLQQIKRSFAGGFTMHVIHGFPSSTQYPNTTWPGYTTFGYEFTEMWNQIQPAWQHMSDALNSVARNQWVLQQGTVKVDLAFYLFASPWLPRTQYNSNNLRDLGYTYDYLGPDNLASPAAYVAAGKLGHPAYKALIVNNQTVSSVAAAESLVQMASAGIPIIIVGSPPSQAYPTDPSSQSSLVSAMSKLMSMATVHRIDSIDQLPSMLANNAINPRVALNCSSNPVYTVFRSVSDVDYVYFFNDQNKDTTCTARVSASGVMPSILDTVTGTQTSLLRYSYTNSTLTIPITLRSNETLTLALEHSASLPKCTFPKSSGTLHSLSASVDGEIHAIITGPATLTASSGKQISFNSSVPETTHLATWDLLIEDWHSAADRFAVLTEITNHTYTNITLTPWNQLDTSLTPVSGVGHYTTRFSVPTPPGNATSLVGILRLPFVQHTARAFLDNKWLGPIDPVNPVVTMSDLQVGQEYELRVEVATTLFNRIKAEANQTWVVGGIAGVRQPKYDTLRYEEYGLVGYVGIEWGRVVRVEC